MSRQVQSARSRSRQQDTPAEEQDTATASQQNEELDADVACCLAAIDEVLSEDGETEHEQAQREFDAITARGLDDDLLDAELRVWQAKYAHLGLRYSISCCGASIW